MPLAGWLIEIVQATRSETQLVVQSLFGLVLVWYGFGISRNQIKPNILLYSKLGALCNQLDITVERGCPRLAGE
jgi:hypothetical protein